MKTPEGDRVMTLLVVIQIVHLTARLIGWSNLLSNDHLAFCSLDKHQNKKCKVIKKLQKKTWIIINLYIAALFFGGAQFEFVLAMKMFARFQGCFSNQFDQFSCRNNFFLPKTSESFWQKRKTIQRIDVSRSLRFLRLSLIAYQWWQSNFLPISIIVDSVGWVELSK